MRQWQVIPKGVVFDNGMPFRGRLLEAFCRNLGIQLIHTAPQHPQTNGKLERAFRDDMPEFYRHQPVWECEALRACYPPMSSTGTRYATTALYMASRPSRGSRTNTA